MRKVRASDPNRSSHPATGAVITVRPDPRVWKVALQATGGDPSRLRVNDDGSVTVENRSIR